MKRAMVMMAVCGALAVLCQPCVAQMLDRSFGTGQTIGASTSTVTYVLRGDLEGVYVDVGTATTRTQTVTVTSSQQTLFTKAVTADGWFPLRYAMYGNTGSALTWTSYGGANNSTNYANTIYDKAPLAGSITVKVVGGNGANKTNTTAVTVVYKQ